MLILTLKVGLVSENMLEYHILYQQSTVQSRALSFFICVSYRVIVILGSDMDHWRKKTKTKPKQSWLYLFSKTLA